MKLTCLSTIVLSAIALTGCPDTHPDPLPNEEALIGTWEEEVSQFDEDPPGQLTFRADGTFEQIDEDLITGTFTADATTLFMTTDTGSEREAPYAIQGNRLTPIALRRATPAASFTGTWRAEGLDDGEPVVMSLELGADASMRLSLGTDILATGTWRDDGGALITTMEIQDDGGQIIPVDLPWHSIADAVSLFVYTRQ